MHRQAVEQENKFKYLGAWIMNDGRGNTKYELELEWPKVYSARENYS